MTMTIDAGAAPAPGKALRTGLIALAAIEALSALTHFPLIFFDHEHTERLLILAQGMTSVRLALSPLIAIAALVFVLKGRLSSAIYALAAVILLRWISELPALAIHGLELSATAPGLFLFVQLFVYPLLAAAAIWVADRDDRIALSAAFVAAPTVLGWLAVVAFGIGVMVKGF